MVDLVVVGKSRDEIVTCEVSDNSNSTNFANVFVLETFVPIFVLEPKFADSPKADLETKFTDSPKVLLEPKFANKAETNLDPSFTSGPKMILDPGVTFGTN